MRLAVILISALTLSACSKRVVDLQKTSHKTRIDKAIDSSSFVQVNTKLASYKFTYSDSEGDYSVDIVPGDEPVNFSADKGFTGKAKSIRIQGKLMQNKVDHDFKAEEKDSLSAKSAKENVKSESEETSKKKNSSRTGTTGFSIIIYIVMAFVAIWLFLAFKSQ